ncbi:MAG: AAA family ATPase [Gammaproteobacteria bacterium]|nr:AAA family ATPase [Gammaproteobacteria bacterium]
MKVQELHLVAFGPFTDKILDFGQDAGGLHIIYGPNEAGKSSALRGFKALLYGIGERTLDNFVHANDKLRVSGCLKAADGREIKFFRRKGRKNTLLSPDGEVLDEQALTPFLQGVSPELFRTLFGIDHQALVQGGREILEQKGEVGQALFSAALGSPALHEVLAQLDEEADSLFRPRGSTQSVNASLKEYAELKKKIKEKSLSSKVWDEHRRALGQTTKELAKIQSELAGNRAEINRLRRIQRLLPRFARQRKLLQELEFLHDIVILPDDFGKRHQQASRELETAQVILAKASPRLKGFQTKLEDLSVNQDLLDQGENIEDLHARLGGHRKALQDHPHIEVERQQLLTDTEFLLKEVKPEFELTDVEKLRPVLSRRQGISELGTKNAVLVARVEQTESSRQEVEARLEGSRKERDGLPKSDSSDALKRTIAAARKLGDIDAAIQSTHSDLVALQAQCDADHSRLTLWDGVLEDLPGLGVPNRESVSRFEKTYDELEKRLQHHQDKQAESVAALQDTSLRLDKIQRMGTVPTETDLVDARSNRDRVWKLLRRQWIDGEDVSEEASHLDVEGTLADVFEERVASSDELSDRLRRESDRVHETANLLARQETAQQKLENLEQKLEACATEKSQIDTEWQTLWSTCQVIPRTPREMRAWLDDLDRLRDKVGQLHSQRQKSDELTQIRNTHIQRLNQQLDALGKKVSKSESLEAMLPECEAAAQQLDDIRQKYKSVDKEIKDLEAGLVSLTNDHRLAMEDLDTWKIQWQKLIENVGLQGDASATEVVNFIEKVRELFVKQSEAEKLRVRIKSIDDDAEAFRSQVADMISNVAPELEDQPADDAVVRLNSLLSDNRSRLTQRQQIEEQIQQVQQEIQDSGVTIQTMTGRLDSLCVEAKCKIHSELEEADRKSAQHLGVKAALDLLKKDILDDGEGATIAELEAEAADTHSDVLPVQIEELRNKIDDELEPKRTELAETKGREEKELELMNGSDHAAALAEQAQAILARIRSDAEHYVRVKLAGRILKDEIECYRKENQGPLVKRASEHFSALTLGSFEGLMTDFNDKDEPILAGIRSDGERVTVEGMSTGSRDQLYLALRLASLEKYMESAEPMPFIVDDVLVDFDDERSEAALNALAILAEKTQVILFTHHSQVVDQVKKLQGSAHVQVHML